MIYREPKPPVYPCVYREHAAALSRSTDSTGLSLCVQGTYHRYFLKRIGFRFIPVCTGNMPILCLLQRSTAVYPCVYREHSYWRRDPIGSTRFIPVCTGNMCVCVCVCVCGLSLCVQGTYQL